MYKDFSRVIKRPNEINMILFLLSDIDIYICTTSSKDFIIMTKYITKKELI